MVNFSPLAAEIFSLVGALQEISTAFASSIIFGMAAITLGIGPHSSWVLYFLKASHVRHISDLHSKFALRPHHVWKYGRHPILDR